VGASPERIWELFARPASFAQWAGIRLVEGPGRDLAPGDRIVFGKGPFRIVWKVLSLDPPRELALDIQVPFGVVNHEVVRISALGGGRSRVTLN